MDPDPNSMYLDSQKWAGGRLIKGKLNLASELSYKKNVASVQLYRNK